MKRFIICFLFAIPLAQNLMAELPNLTGEELADLIQLQENRIQSFDIRYRLTQGKYSEKGDLVPDVIIDCEYGHDLGKGHRYLHEKWVKENLERKYAYDGKTGTDLSLKLPGDPGRMYGTIMPKVPDVFNDQAIWKPECSEYGFIPGFTLSRAIREGKNVKVTSEELNGEKVYRVTFGILIGKRRETIRGKKLMLEMYDQYVAWLSPQKNLRPIRIEDVQGRDGQVLVTCTASDFRQISPGLWLPHRLEKSGTRRRRGRLIEIDTIAINEKASVIPRLEFPPRTYMKDEILGTEYQVGLSDAYIDATIEENVEKIHMAREGKVALPDYNKQWKQANEDNVLVVEEGEESDVKDSSQGHSKRTIVYLILGFFIVLGLLAFAYYMHRR